MTVNELHETIASVGSVNLFPKPGWLSDGPTVLRVFCEVTATGECHDLSQYFVQPLRAAGHGAMQPLYQSQGFDLLQVPPLPRPLLREL